jgi:hypothetical protein
VTALPEDQPMPGLEMSLEEMDRALEVRLSQLHDQNERNNALIKRAKAEIAAANIEAVKIQRRLNASKPRTRKAVTS